MANSGKGLLVLAGMKPKGSDDDSDEDQDSPDESEVSPGEEAAMADFEKSCSASDHEGMAKALADWCDIYMGK
jgi:hypothetical protein